MSQEITTAFRREYSDSFTLKFQQTESLLGPYVRKEKQSSEMAFWDFLGESAVEWDGARHGDTPQMDTPHSRRKCVLHTARWADKIDKPDKVQTLKDPQSDYLRVGTAAIRRAEDERILEAMGAIVYTGKDGTTAVNPYAVGECRMVESSGVIVAAGSDFSNTSETGLTLAKIATIGNLMDEASVPATDRHIVANATNMWYMLGSTKTTSADYAGVRALVRGEVNSYMGFQFHWLPTARFEYDDTDTGAIKCYAWHRDSVLMTTGFELNTEVDRLPTKNYSVQVYAEIMIGAVRLQGPGVVPFTLDPDPTMDFTQG